MFIHIAVLLVVAIFFIPSPIFADVDHVRMLMTTCAEELKSYGEWQKVGNRFLHGRWEAYRQNSVMVLILTITHNLYWFDPDFHSGDKNALRTVSVLLYGKFERGRGWLWYEQINFGSPSGSRQRLQDAVAFMESGKPFGIIFQEKDPERIIAMRYLCRKLLDERLFKISGPH